jgi:hypothetical protein
MELLYNGIEQSLKETLITREAVSNFSSSTAAHVRFSPGDIWMNEIEFAGDESLSTDIQRHDPRLLEHYHAFGHRT